MSGPGFDVILEIVAFLITIWGFERLFELVGLSNIFGAIAAGILCGPNGLDFVPYSCSHNDDEAHQVCEEPTPFVLMGILGVTFLIMESGTHCEFHKVKAVAKNAFVVGFLGTTLPLCSGMGMMVALGFDAFPDGFSAGAALAATSVGIAIKLLKENKQLNSIPGQTIVTAAFIDDIFCLVILVILIKLSEGSITATTIILPFVWCFLFMGTGMFLSVALWPKIIPNFLHRLPSDADGLSIRDMAHLGLMLSFLVGMGWIGSKIGSHLLGAFVAGMSFASIPRSHYVWNRQLKRISQWCVRMFFAATVGFIIPIKVMMKFEPFWKGCVLCLVGCVLAKVAAGLHTGEFRWVIGFAMVGRGEFAYLVAEQASSLCYSGADDSDHRRRFMSGAMRRLLSGGEIDPDCTKMMGDQAFATVVWALLLTVIIAPMAFEYVLRRAFAGKERSGIQQFIIKAQGPHHTGMNYEIMDVLHAMHLDVLEAKMETDGTYTFGEWIVSVTDKTDELDHEKIHEIEHMIHEAVDDEETEIMVCYDWDQENQRESTLRGMEELKDMKGPFSKEKAEKLKKKASGNKDSKPNIQTLPSFAMLADNEEHWLEIRIMAEHDKSIVPDVLKTIDSMGLHIMKAHTEEHNDHEEEIFFAKEQQGGHITRAQMRITLKETFKKHGMHCQILIKRIKAQDVHTLGSHVHRSATFIQSVSNNQMLDKTEEGYEVVLKTLHAERDVHIAAHLAASLQAKNFDVAAFDIDERDDSEHHLVVKMFIREDNPNEYGRGTLKEALVACLKSNHLPLEKLIIDIISKSTMVPIVKTITGASRKASDSDSIQRQCTSIMKDATLQSIEDVYRKSEGNVVKEEEDINLSDYDDNDDNDVTPSPRNKDKTKEVMF